MTRYNVTIDVPLDAASPADAVAEVLRHLHDNALDLHVVDDLGNEWLFAGAVVAEHYPARRHADADIPPDFRPVVAAPVARTNPLKAKTLF